MHHQPTVPVEGTADDGLDHGETERERGPAGGQVSPEVASTIVPVVGLAGTGYLLVFAKGFEAYA